MKFNIMFLAFFVCVAAYFGVDGSVIEHAAAKKINPMTNLRDEESGFHLRYEVQSSKHLPNLNKKYVLKIYFYYFFLIIGIPFIMVVSVRNLK